MPNRSSGKLRRSKSQEQDYLLIGEDMNVVDYKLANAVTPFRATMYLALLL